MGYRYVPEDMIRHSDFCELYNSYSQETREKIDRLVARLIRENPGNRLPLVTGPGYFMMHWLMADLYVSLSIYIIQKDEGKESGAVLEQIDRCLTVSGEKLNQKMKRLMKLPGAFTLFRMIAPKAMTLANGHGFHVNPIDCGENAFGFDVTDCPYCRLYAKYGVPEIGPVICRFDETMSKGIDNLEFVRKGTLCGGYPKCDFLYRKTIN